MVVFDGLEELDVIGKPKGAVLGGGRASGEAAVIVEVLAEVGTGTIEEDGGYSVRYWY